MNGRAGLAILVATLLLFSAGGCRQETGDQGKAADGLSFSVRYDASLTEQPQDGRLLLMLSTHPNDEPRFLVGVTPDTQLIFGRNVENWAGDDAMTVDETAPGFPLADLSKVPAGTYYAQALLNR